MSVRSTFWIPKSDAEIIIINLSSVSVVCKLLKRSEFVMFLSILPAQKGSILGPFLEPAFSEINWFPAQGGFEGIPSDF